MNYHPLMNLLITLIMALLAMAFFTLLERKVLGYTQTRKGPNKVGLLGVPQPMADALKLLSKEQSKPAMSNITPFLMSPVMSLSLALLLWMIYPSSFPSFFFIYGVMFFLCVSSLNVYTTLVAGWASNSKYSLLGALRSIAQTISYEVSMALILLSALLMIKSFDLNMTHMNQLSWVTFLIAPSFFVWFATALAETSRTPFDLAEGESELVSGFNTEYSGGAFTLIFMAEYTNIILMSILSSILFMGGVSAPMMNNFFLLLKTTMIAFMFLWVRASFPRMRYDRLMSLTWKSYLPFSLTLLMIMAPLSMLLL